MTVQTVHAGTLEKGEGFMANVSQLVSSMAC